MIDVRDKNGCWTPGQQNEQGWFGNNGLNDNKNPLTHTMGYTCEVILRIGLALGEAYYIAAEALINVQLTDRSLLGRLDKNGQPTVN